VNSNFVAFNGGSLPGHVEQSVGGVLQFVFEQTVAPMTDFPPDFFAVAANTPGAPCKEFRPPRPFYAPQPEPLSTAPTVTDVRVKAMVAPDGHLYTVEAVDHLYPDLNERAVQIVSGWTYTAPYCDGKPFSIQSNVVVQFNGH
jgi:hypothetical protein